jgi:hypothetical protein
LINDDAELGNTCIEMPYVYILEMICDWWSFSRKTGNLYEIFDWYDEHKSRIEFHPNTKKLVENTLDLMKLKLKYLESDGGATV